MWKVGCLPQMLSTLTFGHKMWPFLVWLDWVASELQKSICPQLLSPWYFSGLGSSNNQEPLLHLTKPFPPIGKFSLATIYEIQWPQARQ